jgi:hypothetical protein
VRAAMLKIFTRIFLCAFVPAFAYFLCDHLALLSGAKWNLLGFAIVMMADPWGTLWSGNGIAMGELVGFSILDAMTIFLLPVFFAINLAIVASGVAWVWHILRRP